MKPPEGKMMVTKPKEIVFFKRSYCGFESLYDLERDIMEAFDKNINSKAKMINDEFMGTVKVVMTYVKEDE